MTMQNRFYQFGRMWGTYFYTIQSKVAQPFKAIKPSYQSNSGSQYIRIRIRTGESRRSILDSLETRCSGSAQQMASKEKQQAIEVEVKLRIPDEPTYDKVIAAFTEEGEWQALHKQQNFFFDGSEQELSKQRVVMRIRMYGGDKKAVLTVKGKMVITDGIGRAPEDEEEVDVAWALAALKEPKMILERKSEVIDKVISACGPTSLVNLGGFNNDRNVFKWNGLTLEVDATSYEWGMNYEIECETTDPEGARQKIGDFLKGKDIQYTYTSTSKFKNFINKSLD